MALHIFFIIKKEATYAAKGLQNLMLRLFADKQVVRIRVMFFHGRLIKIVQWISLPFLTIFIVKVMRIIFLIARI